MNPAKLFSKEITKLCTYISRWDLELMTFTTMLVVEGSICNRIQLQILCLSYGVIGPSSGLPHSAVPLGFVSDPTGGANLTVLRRS